MIRVATGGARVIRGRNWCESSSATPACWRSLPPKGISTEILKNSWAYQRELKRRLPHSQTL